MNVTELPWQVGLEEGVIVIETGADGIMVIVSEFDVAGLPVAQVRSEVS